MDMDADVLAMLDRDEFGASVSTLDGVDIQGIFDAEYFEVDAGGEVGSESTQPGFVCRDSDLPANPRDLVLSVDGTSYTVITPKPDGTGVTALVLEAV
ncbi:hypothetical protein KAR91_09595 [Candidatus Pacearchaeota archaeon]|nr:hypothetical protein [Candidatus Pacearchaeota archaeon]